MIYFLICIVIIIPILGYKLLPIQYDNKSCNELFWKKIPKIGTVYKDNNSYYEILSVRTFGAAWKEITFGVYLKYQKSPVLFYTSTHVIPFNLVEIKANDVEDFKRVKSERLKDSQEKFNIELKLK